LFKISFAISAPLLPTDYDARFIYEKIGYNLSPLELQAAMGRVQLKIVKKIKQLRNRNFQYLYGNLSQFEDLALPKIINGAEPSWFAMPLTTAYSNREPLVAFLEKNGVETRSMFSGNILSHPAYKGIKVRSMLKKNSECHFILTNSFWVSVHPRYSLKDLDGIIAVFRKYYDRVR